MTELEPKPPEILQKLKWLRQHGVKYWRYILVALLVLAIAFALDLHFGNKSVDKPSTVNAANDKDLKRAATILSAAGELEQISKNFGRMG